MTAEDYELLSQIAPTLAQSADFPELGMPWQEKTLLTGQALGRTEQAEQVGAETEDLLAAAREAHPSSRGPPRRRSCSIASPAPTPPPTPAPG